MTCTLKVCQCPLFFTVHLMKGPPPFCHATLQQDQVQFGLQKGVQLCDCHSSQAIVFIIWAWSGLKLYICSHGMDYIISMVWEFSQDYREYGMPRSSLYWNLLCNGNLQFREGCSILQICVDHDYDDSIRGSKLWTDCLSWCNSHSANSACSYVDWWVWLFTWRTVRENDQ